MSQTTVAINNLYIQMLLPKVKITPCELLHLQPHRVEALSDAFV